jgi:hypothetical protein
MKENPYILQRMTVKENLLYKKKKYQLKNRGYLFYKYQVKFSLINLETQDLTFPTV